MEIIKINDYEARQVKDGWEIYGPQGWIIGYMINKKDMIAYLKKHKKVF